MALIDYVTLQTMKTYANVDAETTYDALLSESIASASREVDERCDRYFGKDDMATTRTFDCYGDGLLLVDDIADATDLLIDGTPLTSSHKLLPRNGIVAGSPGWPYTRIKHCGFFEGESYEVTAVFGWASVPDVVVEATKMLAAENFLAKDTPHGVKGFGEFGTVRMNERKAIERKLLLYKRNPVEFA